jgi:hypothetical protein
MKALIILSIVISSSLAIAKEEKVKDLPRFLKQYVVEQVESQLDFSETNADENQENEIWPLSRITLRSYAYLKLDVLFFEARIKPYVELRWDKKNPVGYQNYKPKRI